MSWVTRASAVSVVVCSALGFFTPAAPASATAKKLKPITGTLNKPGYTVMAIADSGRAATVRARGRRFSLRPPADHVTLHLRASDGTYAGEIVIGREMHGKRVILGVKAGARLGTIEVETRKGYAKLSHRPAKRWIVFSRWARARKGVPLGNGRNDGLVRSRHAHGPRSDPDLDGVPNSLDVDDDGDLILDNYDRANQGGASTSDIIGVPYSDGNFMDVGTALIAFSADAVNVNGGSSDEQIGAAEQSHERLGILWTGIDHGSGELNCGALVYCSPGGTGKLQVANSPDTPAFPECCDPDGNGFGSFTEFDPPIPGMSLYAGATDEQMRAGDVLIGLGTMHGAPVEFASTVGFVFSTPSVLAAYDDGQGDSGTLSYPRAKEEPPIRVRANPDGDVILTMTFWRPQRRRIEGEEGEGKWMDIGNLLYAAGAQSARGGGVGGVCPQSSYSAMDPNLIPDPTSANAKGPPTLGGIRFEDTKGDQPSDPGNTFSYTLNLTQCLAAQGLAMSSAEPVVATFWAFSAPPNGMQSISSSMVQFQLRP